MTMYGISHPTSLQTILAAATAESSAPPVYPHHPITCAATLEFEDDTLRCEHAETDDLRVRKALTHSIATLLIELAYERFGGPVEEKKQKVAS
jgi:hypothetical protein